MHGWQFNAAFLALDTIPLLKAFMNRMAEVPRIKAYLATAAPFSGNSMM